MDKCFTFTMLLLVNLEAVVDSRVSYECEPEEEDSNETPNPNDGYKNDTDENEDLWLEFTSDAISYKTNKTQHYFCDRITQKSKNIIKCNDKNISCPSSCSGDPSSWSSWSQCVTSGEGYKHRSLKCPSNQSECLVPSNGSSFEISTCIPDSASSTTEKVNCKEIEKRYTLTEIILVALCCLLMGILLTTLVFVLYMKRTLQGCFSKHIKDVQGDSKQQSGPDMQFLSESGVVKKYDPNNPKSADSKNENKADDTKYQSLNSDQVGNDQKTYNQLNVNVSGSVRQGHQPSSSRLQQTGSGYKTDQITNLQHKNDYFRDSDIDGHNYFVLERENMSYESRARNLGRPEAHAKMDDEVKNSTLGREDKQSDESRHYFILEHIENGHNQD
ncbi:hypothetical protein ACJMK2_016524 [Sinanodonta woodiana]|uniref:Uncharacterized protein n=1 Tax=Sinanodonta woodiana TaxID=1069815 RepID=A0ABD3UTV5_SINWO